MQEGLAEKLGCRDFAGVIKQLDAQIKQSDQNTQAQLQQLLLNRGYFLSHLGLYRKAVKDFDAVLAFSPSHAVASLQKAKVHVALKQMEEAEEALSDVLQGAALTADLATALEAQQLLKALRDEAVKPGTKLPLLPQLAPAAPAAPPPRPATPPAAPTAARPVKAGLVELQDAGVQTDAATAAAAAADTAAAAAAAEPPAAAARPAAQRAAKPAAGDGKAAGFAAAAALAGAGGAPSRGASAKAGKRAQAHAAAAAPPAAPAVPAAPAEQEPALDPLARLLVNTDPNTAVSMAINMVNSGECRKAVDLLDVLLKNHPDNVGALAARGTAKALLARLQEAVDDFSRAVELGPGFYDFYKRRGQALSALGRDEEAVADLRQAAELCPDAPGQADILSDIAKVFQKQKDHRRTEIELKAALERNPNDAQLLGMLGLAQVSQGDLEEGIATYERALQLDPENKDLILNLGMALKEMCVVSRAEQTLRRAIKLSRGGTTAVHAYRLLSQMKQGLGDHMGAIRELNKALTVAEKTSQRIELRFLRGACHHALGLHKQACDDYQSTLECQQAAGLTTEAMQASIGGGWKELFLCLAFYQKELALYVRKQLDNHIHAFCLDAEIGPEFKELWCKKAPPGPAFVEQYRHTMQPHPNWNAPKPPAPPAELLDPLLCAADALGLLVQYTHQGFLPNARQQRMAGLAALEFAQTLAKLVEDRRAGRKSWVANAGASVSAKAADRAKGRHLFGWRDAMDVIVRWRQLAEPNDQSPMTRLVMSLTDRYMFGWRDAMDVIVRWRQLAEPNDQVIWVDLLTEREFNAGFGSHTPMFTGQTKCVRYYMNFERALDLMRGILAKEGHAFDAENKEVPLDSEDRRRQVAEARTAGDMWQALGKDAWVVVPIESSQRSGHSMEGTRLTVVKLGKEGAPAEDDEASYVPAVGLANGVQGEAPAAPAAIVPPKPRPQPDAYEFSIRTPVTPVRWKDYDEELAGVFEGLVAALTQGDLHAVADQAMRFAYYWYNFMPLARGSAFCGYVSLLGAFLAAGAPVRARMPKSYQTDWEAILSTSPSQFIASVSAWMLPPELRAGGSNGNCNAASSGDGGGSSSSEGRALPPPPIKPLGELPSVVGVLDTMRKRLEALNGPNVDRL
ncbi:hypothetical protein N2152v2_001621 [Parachlorella kessleri]